MTDAGSAQSTTTRTRVAIAFAVLGLLGTAILVGFELYLALSRTGFAGLAVAVTHVLYGWIPLASAVVGLILRRTRLTIGATIVTAAAFILPLVLLPLLNSL
ncbi:hypothetical protein A0130_16230 [Leifsonia xyli]|uniref:hypothetical protein n=1 Tax=Leifsonia xyli TaxID=1575 RepID=UPI0007CE0173|nr:hypothetical protein A0130_16230 [Leifsonia xyli]